MSFDPLKWATRVVLVALSLTIAIDLIATVSDASYHSLVVRIPSGGVTPEQAQAADDRQTTIGVVQLVLFRRHRNRLHFLVCSRPSEPRPPRHIRPPLG